MESEGKEKLIPINAWYAVPENMYESVIKMANDNGIPLDEIEEVMGHLTIHYKTLIMDINGGCEGGEQETEYNIGIKRFDYKTFRVSIIFKQRDVKRPTYNQITEVVHKVIMARTGAVFKGYTTEATPRSTGGHGDTRWLTYLVPSKYAESVRTAVWTALYPFEQGGAVWFLVQVIDEII